MKIAFFGLPKADQVVFQGVFGEAKVLFYEEILTESNIEQVKDADVLCVFVSSPIDKKMIDLMPNLKFIATRSTGFDTIDCEYAKTKGIQVSNVPAYGSHTVAEFAFGLILNLSRKIVIANDYIRGSADFHYNPRMQGFDLVDKTLGVIGTGKIGKNIIKIAKGFGMKIVAYDLYPDATFANESGFSYKSFDEVMATSDIITLHAPYTKENHHLINQESISRIKKGACIINTARGELIDTQALIEGLKKGIVAGAGLDVLEGEGDLKKKNNSHITLLNMELMQMPNVIVTPHIAFYTGEAVAEIFRVTILNIQGFIAGKPVNLVN